MEFSFFLNHEESFLEFNFNILETNIVNILLLIALLIYVKVGSLDPNLRERQGEIILTLENAQKDLTNAFDYYSFCERSFQDTISSLADFKVLSENQKVEIVNLKYKNVKSIIKENFLATKTLVKNFEKKSFLSLQKSINYFVASKVLRKFFTLTEKEQSKLLEITIAKLAKRN